MEGDDTKTKRAQGADCASVHTQADLDRLFGKGRFLMPLPQPASLYAVALSPSCGPVFIAPTSVRGLYADTPEHPSDLRCIIDETAGPIPESVWTQMLAAPPPTAALEGSMDWKDDDLISVLKESKEWAACAKSCRERWAHDDDDAARAIRNEVVGPAAYDSIGLFQEEYRPPLSALRAVRDEVKSGAILGSFDRCCVCGSTVGPMEQGPNGGWFCKLRTNPACEAAFPADQDFAKGQELVAQILRARRLLAERTSANVPSAKGPECPRCDGTLEPRMESDTYRCNSCGWTVVSLLVRTGSLPGQKRHPSPKVDPYAAQVEREKRLRVFDEMTLRNAGFFATVTKPKALAYLDEMRRQDRRNRVLMGLERGTDPRMVGTCGDWPTNRGPR